MICNFDKTTLVGKLVRPNFLVSFYCPINSYYFFQHFFMGLEQVNDDDDIEDEGLGGDSGNDSCDSD